MNYIEIKKYDIANGEGIRVSLFVSGCTHKCKGCFNTSAWDFNSGNIFTQETLKEIKEALKPAYIKGLSLLGGEPFEIENASNLIDVVKDIKKEYPNKDIWAYSGYTYEELIKNDIKNELVKLIDVLVDGKFILELKNPSLAFRGSENQRIIDIKKTIKKGCIVLHPKNEKGLKNETKRI